ncbi:MAG: NADPH-dependent 7-cyano-7-deazaguanine reductase QueF [Woeseiaceae bacterium]
MRFNKGEDRPKTGRYITLRGLQPTGSSGEMNPENPLGNTTRYPTEYAPEVLFAVPREESRAMLLKGAALPFHGTDIWNVWELSWLDTSGKPIVATAAISVDAGSTNIVESKSLKLYLNSLAMTRFESTEEIRQVIVGDLARTVIGDIGVDIRTATNSTSGSIDQLPGTCIDTQQVSAWSDTVDPAILACNKASVVAEELHSHLLRSNCPITDQPDTGSILIRYKGPKIEEASLLRYLVSFRRHNDFHEACVERIFLDIRNRCATRALTVYACYNRRGGIDINPYRTDTHDAPAHLRLWRQ